MSYTSSDHNLFALHGAQMELMSVTDGGASIMWFDIGQIMVYLSIIRY